MAQSRQGDRDGIIQDIRRLAATAVDLLGNDTASFTRGFRDNDERIRPCDFPS